MKAVAFAQFWRDNLIKQLACQARAAERGCDERRVFASGTPDTTWIKPFGQEWKQVTYYAVDGLAVFEGCVILGTVEEAKAVKAQIEANPELLTPGTQPFGSAIVGVQYRWKNNLLPYEIDPALPNQSRVTDAIAHWEQNTPFRFVKRDPDKFGAL